MLLFCPAYTLKDCTKKFCNTQGFFLWVIVLSCYVLEAPLSSFTLRNGSHFCLCYFRFSLTFIGVAKSNGKERMTFPLCSSVWLSCQAEKPLNIFSELDVLNHICCPQAMKSNKIRIVRCWTPDIHQSISITPLCIWKGERKYKEGFIR